MRTLIITLLLFCGYASHAQIVARLYYDQRWELTWPDSSKYFRVSVFDTLARTFAGQVRDFTREAKPVMTGSYAHGGKNGEFNFYFLNGKLERTGYYVDGERNGIWKYYYENGALRAEIQFQTQPDKSFSAGIVSFYDSSGNQLLKEGTGLWIEEYLDPRFDQPIINSGSFLNNQKDGIWTCTLKDGQLIYTEKYKNGKFLSGKSTELIGKPGSYARPMENHLVDRYWLRNAELFYFARGVNLATLYPYLAAKRTRAVRHLAEDSVTGTKYVVVEISAEPEEGMREFYRIIGEQIQIPKEARKMKLSGRVFIEFVIEKDGSLNEIKVIKGIGGGCDEEALRAMKDYARNHRWKPGTQKGNPVRQQYTLPITFNVER